MPHGDPRAPGGADSGRDSDGDTYEPKHGKQARARSKSTISPKSSHSEGEVASWDDQSPGEDWPLEVNRRSIDDEEAGWFEGGDGIFENVRDSPSDEVGGNPNDIVQQPRFGAKTNSYCSGKRQGGGWNGAKEKRWTKNKGIVSIIVCSDLFNFSS